jgi:hypothetical protein
MNREGGRGVNVPRTAGPKRFHPHYYAVLDWVLTNPHRNDSEGAKELNLTPSWFSMIINSDMFQAQLAERARELGVELGVRGIHGQMVHAASLAMQKTIELLESGDPSESFVSGTRDSLLAKLGYTKETHQPGTAKYEFNLNVATVQEARDALNKIGNVTDVTPNE